MSTNIAFLAIAGLDVIFIALSQIALWQRKEYRIDRMRAHVMSPEFDRRTAYIWGIAGFLVLFSFLHIWFGVVGVAILLASYGVRALKKGIYRPVFTVRASIVLGLSIGILILLITLSKSTFITGLTVVCSPIIIAFVVAVVSTPVLVKKRAVIQKAIQYRKNLRNLTVIGITGSVGKTSTKTYALHLLQDIIGDVVATQEHRNSPYVVALDMLERVTENTKTYIVEMGAYTIGEIKELCDIVQPNIGVITAITNQHVALFRSLERLAKTKWELADAIPPSGMLILNKDDETIRTMAEGVLKRIIWFSMKDRAEVMLENIVMKKDSVEADLVLGGTSHHIHIPVVSRGQLGSVLAGCAIAHALHVDVKEIVAKLATLAQIEKTMELKTISDTQILIDDSYSASEASVLNAIEYLKSVGNEKSLLIMVPIIELGTEGNAVHERIGRALADAVFQVMIYGDAYKDDFMRGLNHKVSKNITWYSDAKLLEQDIKKTLPGKNIVVLEGRLPEIICNSVIP